MAKAHLLFHQTSFSIQFIYLLINDSIFIELLMYNREFDFCESILKDQMNYCFIYHTKSINIIFLQVISHYLTDSIQSNIRLLIIGFYLTP